MAVERLTRQCPPVGLEAVVATAGLQRRVDRKYLVRADDLAALLAEPLADARCLEIDGRRQFRYDSTYFDTPDLRCFRDHVQGRRLRAKVRTRTYTDSGECVLEVKRTGAAGRTVKDRLPWDVSRAGELSAEGEAFVTERMPAAGFRLQPAARTAYLRSTVVLGHGRRATVDAGLLLERAGRRAEIDGCWALVESKTDGPAGAVDLALAAGGYRPVSVSKYCLAIALLEPTARSNPWHRLMRRHFGWSGDRREGWAA